MIGNYYSMSEFNKFDIESMKNIVLTSYNKDYETIDSNDVEYLYVANKLNKHINEMMEFYNLSITKVIYYIYYEAKTQDMNVYQYIYKMYKDNNLNVCFTKTSDITLLLLKIEKYMKQREE